MPKPRLTRASIVATAIRIADEKGLAAVTLRGIATRLGVHVTSLYHHVPTKEAVLAEMTKALIAEANLPAGAIAWQDWVRGFAAALRALARRHPGAFEALHYVPATGEKAAEALETALAAFRSAGFDAVTSYNAIKTTGLAVLGLVLDDTARLRGEERRTALDELPEDRFPRIKELDRLPEEDDTFAFLVDTLIEGFAASARRAQSAD